MDVILSRVFILEITAAGCKNAANNTSHPSLTTINAGVTGVNVKKQTPFESSSFSFFLHRKHTSTKTKIFALMQYSSRSE
ncbi:hypothetical protein T4E_5796 [Trichinella pseudospiralis]|uniref:Uncharacterized protein n=1 Tax=Trichinella pseudospiralis TaxID=6337 RepID=A0A0V0Y7B0_TRIPS|nr:hypothetical protein T4E_5796 [Trichinella pseudospiralis]